MGKNIYWTLRLRRTERIKIDRLNNIYVVGYADSALLCIKYNTNGDSVWVRRYQPPGGFRAAAFACTIDDSMNVIMTGGRNFGMPPESLLTVKYSSDGNFRWARSYGYDNLINRGIKIAADQYGSVYVGGYTRISGLFVYLTLKYDRNGVQQWASIYNGPGNGDDFLFSIAADRIHNFVLATGRNTVSGMLAYYATIKYNATSGDSAWVRRYGANNYLSTARDIQTDSSGSSYVTGGSGPYNSNRDVVTIRYSSQGNEDWVASYNGPANGDDAGVSLQLDNLNNLYVLGTSQGDYIVIKYSQLVGIQTLNNGVPREYKLFQNFPNPFNPVTTIKFSIPKKSFVQLKVYDVLGRVREALVDKELNSAEYEVTLDATNYSSGVYFYKLIANGNVMDTKKLILLK